MVGGNRVIELPISLKLNALSQRQHLDLVVIYRLNLADAMRKNNCFDGRIDMYSNLFYLGCDIALFVF